MRFVIQKSDTQSHWVCTDTENKIVCSFEQGKHNDTQQFTALDEFDPQNYMHLASFARQMADWLRENHYDKVF